MDYHFYKKSGGSPRSVTTADLAEGAAYVNTEIVAAEAGKKIVPMWMVLSSTNAAAVYQAQLLSGSAVLITDVFNSPSSNFPVFLKFNGGLLGGVVTGANLQFGVSGTLSTNITVTVGYYVIDG